jgi:hypothetical protein
MTTTTTPQRPQAGAKTTTERQREFRARMRATGREYRSYWVTPETNEKIKALVAEQNRSRGW